MIRWIALLTALWILPAALASGQIAVQPGEVVRIEAESTLKNPTFVWTIRQGEAVVDTRSGASFAYAFADSGNYTVELLAEDVEVGAQEVTNVDVLVGKSNNELLPLRAVFKSLPAANDSGEAQLNATGPQAVLYASESEGNIAEYRFDRNIAVDSDGDGDPANDIDNSADESLRSGAPWGVTFAELTEPVTARLTVVGEDSSEASADITFVPKPEPAPDTKLTASITAVPTINSDGEMLLAGEAAEAVLYFGDSKGDIIQYRFDRNIAVDSDGDGDPANDIDNKNHPSFLSGEPLQVTLRKSEGESQIFQLIVVSADGKGSRIRRRVVFQESTPVVPPQGNVELAPRLFLDHSQVAVGETVLFQVFGAPQGTRFSWDFDNDGEIDASSETATARYAYQNEGEFTPSVTVVRGDQSKVLTESIMVSGIADEGVVGIAPTADFSFVVEGNTVRFTDLSAADPRNTDPSLQHQWEFGDGETSDETDPEHGYAATGTFAVTLTVTDSAGESASKTVEITIAEITTTPSPSAEATDATETPSPSATPSEPDVDTDTGGNIFFTLIKWLLFLLFFVLLLLVGYFVYRKIHDPDQSFQEILDEERERFFHFHSHTTAQKDEASPFVVQNSASAPAQDGERSIEDATIIEKPTASRPPLDPHSPFVEAEQRSSSSQSAPKAPQQPQASSVRPEQPASGDAAEQSITPPEPPFKQSSPPAQPQTPSVMAPPPAAPPDTKAPTEQKAEVRSDIKEEMPDWLREDRGNSASPPPAQASSPQTQEPPAVPNPHREAPAVETKPQQPAPPPPPAQAPHAQSPFASASQNPSAPPPPQQQAPTPTEPRAPQPTEQPAPSPAQPQTPSPQAPTPQFPAASAPQAPPPPQPQRDVSAPPPPPAPLAPPPTPSQQPLSDKTGPRKPSDTQKDIAGEIDLPIKRDDASDKKSQ